MDIVKSSVIPDWYYMTGTPFGVPEGSLAQWLDLIQVIKDGNSNFFRCKRLAFERYKNGNIHFYSPRNRDGRRDVVIVKRKDVPKWLKMAKNALQEYQLTKR
jgi:hypothetical protein